MNYYNSYIPAPPPLPYPNLSHPCPPWHTYKNNLVKRRIPVPPPLEKSEFYCSTCEKSFFTHGKYNFHINFEHVKCSQCNYSSSLDLLEIHQLSHINASDGKSLLESYEENKLWLDARKANHPLNPNRKNVVKNPYEPSKPCSVLERFLRSRMATALGQSHLRRKLEESSALVPNIESIIKRQKTARLPTAPSNKKVAVFNRTKNYSEAQLLDEFPICLHYLKFKTCKWNPCMYSHNIAAYNRWKSQKTYKGLDSPIRPPLLYSLLLPDIKKLEARVIQALKYLVQENFFLEEPNNQLQNNNFISYNSPDNSSINSEDSNYADSIHYVDSDNDEEKEEGEMF